MLLIERRQRVGGTDILKAELTLDCRNEHGEGVLWNALDHRLWWTDIHGKALWAYDPDTRQSERFLQSHLRIWDDLPGPQVPSRERCETPNGL